MTGKPSTLLPVDSFPMTESTASTGFRFSKNTLANGLDVIFRRQQGRPIVAVNLWYHVGSKNEERTQRGFTHLVEHLMFEGSENYPGDFFKHLQKLAQRSMDQHLPTERTTTSTCLPPISNGPSPWSLTAWPT